MIRQDRKRVVEEWLERASHDWETAQQLVDHGEFHPDVVGMLIQQAMEKFLKGYLISRGWELERIHDLERLCKIASKYNENCTGYVDLCIEIGDFYITGRYPPIVGEELTRKDVEDALKSATEPIDFILKQMQWDST